MNNDDIMVQTAYELASQAHRFQFRKKSGLPYIVHPCRVASDAAKLGKPILTAAAFCHDILEDCREGELGYYTARLKELGQVYDIVKDLTYTGSSKEEKEAYLASFANKPVESYIIKVLDRVDNVEDFAANGDKEYARIYAKKAQVLIDIWDSHMRLNVESYLKESYLRGTLGVVHMAIETIRLIKGL
jgi:(p)ppGpp synthase/HD superfamily hydrolase